MARTQRKNITTDEDTEKCFLLWKSRKGMGRSEVIRVAVQAYTQWKRTELAPKPEDFEGVDISYE